MKEKAIQTGEIIKQYAKLLRECGNLNLSEFPESILPASKNIITQAFEQKIASTQNNEEENKLLINLQETLDLFKPEKELEEELKERLIRKLIPVPFLIALIYSILITVKGDSWLWIISAFLIGISLPVALTRRLDRKKSNFSEVLITELWLFIALSISFGIGIKLAFISGFYGLYVSIFKGFNFLGLLVSVLAILFGRYYLEKINKLYYFLNLPSQK